MAMGRIMTRHYAADGGLGSLGTDGKFRQLDKFEESIPALPSF
jgi:hypothetical protein